VAYLRHARTVTSKHVPAITQQYTKRCFLHAEPSRDELRIASQRVTSPCIASPRLLPGNSYKHLDDTIASAVTQQLKRFSRMSDQGFIGETEARLRGVLDGRQPWMVRNWRRADRENRRLMRDISSVRLW
jgi:hypothetical protein